MKQVVVRCRVCGRGFVLCGSKEDLAARLHGHMERVHPDEVWPLLREAVLIDAAIDAAIKESE